MQRSRAGVAAAKAAIASCRARWLAGALIALALAAHAGAATFALTDTRGRVHTLEAHRGSWVLVNLWATWCAPCLAEMHELQALSLERSDLVVLGLAVDGQSSERIERLAAKLGVGYPVVAGNAALARPFGARGVPTSILYDPSGAQVLVKEGPVTRQEIERKLDRMNSRAHD